MIIDFFLLVLLVYIYLVSPLPSLPITIPSYSKMGLLGGFLFIIISENLALLSQYYLVKSLRKKIFILLRFENLIDTYSDKVSNFSTLDLFFIRQIFKDTLPRS